MKDFNRLLHQVERSHLKDGLPTFSVGDQVKLGIRIREGNKERTQYFNGLIIAQKNASIRKSILVRRIFQGIGIERSFLLHSPKIVSLHLRRSSQVRRSKLYYLRTLYGKASRLKESIR